MEHQTKKTQKPQKVVLNLSVFYLQKPAEKKIGRSLPFILGYRAVNKREKNKKKKGRVCERCFLGRLSACLSGNRERPDTPHPGAPDGPRRVPAVFFLLVGGNGQVLFCHLSL